MQHRHVMRLAATEAAMQVARLAAYPINRRADEAQGILEASDQLRRHYILIERLLRFGYALGQDEDEVALAYMFRQFDQFADEFLGHGYFLVPLAGGPAMV